MTTPNTAARMIARTRNDTGIVVRRELPDPGDKGRFLDSLGCTKKINSYKMCDIIPGEFFFNQPFTDSVTMVACCLPPQNLAVQVRLLTPSPSPVAMNVMVEVVFQMPCDIMVCMTSLVRSVTFHENSGGCDGQVCVTEQETVILEPASTSAGTSVMTGFSGEAEHLKQRASNVVD